VDLNEPRWGASSQVRFDNDQTNRATIFGSTRMIRSGNYLYVSMQVMADDQVSSQDFVSFGLFKTGVAGKIIQIPVIPGGTDPHPSSGIKRYSLDGSTWRDHDANPTNTAVTANEPWVIESSIGVFTNHPANEGGAAWAVQFIVDIEKLGITDASPDFKIYMVSKAHAEATNNDADGAKANVISIPARLGVQAEVGETLVYDSTSAWASENIMTPCPDGLELSELGIGTVRGTDLSSDVTTKTGEVNTFAARPTWEPVDLRITPGRVKARFKINDWGAQMPGVDPYTQIPGGEAVNHNPANGEFKFTCRANTATAVCPNALGVGLNPAIAAQCMSVELTTTAGVPIKTPITHRNMAFAELSERILPARISTKGLQARTGLTGSRPVLFTVITQNMPAIGNWPMFLDSALLNRLKQLAIGLINEINPFGLSLDRDQYMRIAWPTYNVHVSYDTGRARSFDGKAYREYSPMNSFGYHLSHSGVFYGYTHALGGNTLQRRGTSGVYSGRVAGETRPLDVTTGVRTEDLPAWLVNTNNLVCRVFPFCAANYQ